MKGLQNNEIVLLLTGCVAPQNMSDCILQNANIRRDQYIEALTFYITNTSNKIVFVENSGYDLRGHLAGLLEQNKERIEIMTFMAPAFDPSLGKGYGEMFIIKYALQNSSLIKNASYIIKLTGRIIIKNINNHIKQIKPDHIYGSLTFDFTSIGTVIVGAPVPFFEHLIQNHHLINDAKKVYFEHVFLYTIDQAEKKELSHMQQAILPFAYKGIAGTSGKPLNSNPLLELARNLIKYIKLAIGFGLRPTIGPES